MSTLPNEELQRCGHIAVHLEHYILVFGGTCPLGTLLSCHIFWMYNLYTEKWRRFEIPSSKAAPPSCEGCAVAIELNIYVFDGRAFDDHTSANAVWKLTRDREESFVWSRIVETSKMKVPSPRRYHTGWEYEGNMWIFSGEAGPPDGYLNNYGDFTDGFCNQLLSFNPCRKEWTNPKCLGSVPTPRFCHESTCVGDKVWLYGGKNSHLVFEDFYELDMRSLSWTQIHTSQPKRLGQFLFSLNAIAADKLVLHAGITSVISDIDFSNTCWWMMDLASRTWKQIPSGDIHHRYGHTGTRGLNNHVVIIGSHIDYDNCHVTYNIRLEPKCLKQLAIQIIDKHRESLPLQCLPKRLIANLVFN